MAGVPTLSSFYGIDIRMYFRTSEHNPPHVHASYSGNEAVLDIATGAIMAGSLPARALSLVREWLVMHRDELLDIWETQEFHRVDPLQ